MAYVFSGVLLVRAATVRERTLRRASFRDRSLTVAAWNGLQHAKDVRGGKRVLCSGFRFSDLSPAAATRQSIEPGEDGL